MTEQEYQAALAAKLAEAVAEERAQCWADSAKFDRLVKRRPNGPRCDHWVLMTRAAFAAWSRLSSPRYPSFAEKLAALITREQAEDYEDARAYLGAVVERLSAAAQYYRVEAGK